MPLFKIKTSSFLYKHLGNRPGKPLPKPCTMLGRGCILVIGGILFVSMTATSLAALMMIMGSFALLDSSPLYLESPFDVPVRFFVAGAVGWAALACLVFLAWRVGRFLCQSVVLEDDAQVGATEA
ncbi:hypothetical protein ACOI1H_23235 [Loktanella sp. DJP18]|uniref:hypothetical protein n=1 Tax=Loktanella sp. DJP18 TaxID=3409788 RepID=UPI003BB74F50